MPKIILPDFSTKDFIQIVDTFLFLDTIVSLPAGSLAPLREHLVKWGKSFQKIFQAYFDSKDIARYETLTQRMEEFIKQLHTFTNSLSGQEKKAFLLFWNEIASNIENDSSTSQDTYLKNSCNYFIWELNKLTNTEFSSSK